MIKRATLSAVVLTTALAGFTGPAWGGNGHGNGNGNANGNSEAAPGAAPAPAATAAPGNSANAPGREKKSEPTQAASATPPVHDTKPSTSGHGNSANSPALPGVKPTSTTSKNTNAPAASNRTKRYGNGTTAGQIAIQHGYPANGNLYGPGNSQPHKVVTCGHRHGVDVHALKSHPASKTCTGQTSSGRPATQVSSPSCTCAAVTSRGATSTSSSGASSSHHESGRVRSNAGSDPSAGLDATATLGQGTLPFTGFPLWVVTGIALALIVVGLAARRAWPAPEFRR